MASAAPIPMNEDERLEVLDRLQVFDSIPARGFDGITQRLASYYSVPIALVTLVCDQRQWYLSKQGLERDQSNRDYGFSAHAILQDDVFVVRDATQDARFSNNVTVSGDPGVRYYAGAPLLTAEGVTIGAVAIMDVVTRDDIHDFSYLESQAKRVITKLEDRARGKDLVFAIKTTLLDSTIEYSNTDVICRVDGSLRGPDTSRWCERLLSRIPNTASALVIDLQQCNKVDSMGVGALVKVYKACKKNNIQMTIKNTQPSILRLFELTRLDKILTFE